MIEAIVLTEHGETMLDDIPDVGRNDETVLPSQVGVHRFCRGFIKIVPVSTMHKALVCQKCCMRLVVPTYLMTYGDLRKYCEKMLKEEGQNE